MPDIASAVRAADVGGTHVTVATVDAVSGRLLDTPRRSALPAGGGRESLLDAMASALAGAGDRSLRWSLALPGPFDYEHGISRIAGLAKLDALHGVDLRAALGARLGTDVAKRMVFLNDAHAFGLGEWWAGNARGHARVVGVTIGTGLGSVFLHDGERVKEGPLVPRDGWVYHLPADGSIADDVVSSRGILRRYGAGDDTSVRDIAARARAGDDRAAGVFADTGRMLGQILTPWVERFGASCLVVGGSIANAWELMAAHVDVSAAGARAVRADHLEHAPLLGAAVFAVRVAEGRSTPG